jgi:hypothetical protein
MSAATAATYSKKIIKLFWGGWKLVVGTVTGDASYPALGYHFRPSDIGLAHIHGVVFGAGGDAVTMWGKYLNARVQFRLYNGDSADNAAAVENAIIPFIAIGW